MISNTKGATALSIIFAAHATLFASWAAHIPQIQAALHLNFATLGMALLGTPVGAVAAMMITGRLLHRRNSAWLLRCALVGYCVCAPLVGLARSPVELFVALALWGAFQGSVDVAMNAYGADIERRSHRPALPKLHGQWSLGALAGAAIGLAAVSMHLTLSAQQAVLGLVVVCVTGWATIGFSALDSIPSRTAHMQKADHRIPARALMTLGFLAFASSLCEGIVSGWSAVYLDNVGARTTIVGLGFLGFSVGMVIVRFGGNRLLATEEAVRGAASSCHSGGGGDGWGPSGTNTCRGDGRVPRDGNRCGPCRSHDDRTSGSTGQIAPGHNDRSGRRHFMDRFCPGATGRRFGVFDDLVDRRARGVAPASRRDRGDHLQNEAREVRWRQPNPVSTSDGVVRLPTTRLQLANNIL